VHKPVWMIVTLALVLTLVGCGSGGGSNTTTIDGNWSASLISTSGGQPLFSFTTTLTETGGSGLSITNFTITSNGSCFVSGQTTETGSFTLSGNFSGSVMGTFGMTVTGSQNVLTLQGGIGPNNTLTGNWSVTGSTCSGEGTFIFTRV
jgi:hypothetical protein